MSDIFVTSSEHTTPDNANSSDNTDDPLSDEVIAEGDEHIWQITGGPQASMMTLETLKHLVKQFL